MALSRSVKGQSVSRYARRKDGNHAELSKAFLQLGCSVADLSNAGLAGWPDVVIGACGIDRLVEYKNPETRYGRAGLNANQSAFERDWRGGKLFVVSTIDEVAALVSNWRRQ